MSGCVWGGVCVRGKGGGGSVAFITNKTGRSVGKSQHSTGIYWFQSVIMD